MKYYVNYETELSSENYVGEADTLESAISMARDQLREFTAEELERVSAVLVDFEDGSCAAVLDKFPEIIRRKRFEIIRYIRFAIHEVSINHTNVYIHIKRSGYIYISHRRSDDFLITMVNDIMVFYSETELEDIVDYSIVLAQRAYDQ